jgi:hypothetical protein
MEQKIEPQRKDRPWISTTEPRIEWGDSCFIILWEVLLQVADTHHVPQVVGSLNSQGVIHTQCHDLAFLDLSRTLSFAQFALLIAAQTHPRVSDQTTNDRGY